MGAEGLGVTGMTTPGSHLMTPGGLLVHDDPFESDNDNAHSGVIAVAADQPVYGLRHSIDDHDADELFDDDHIPKSAGSLGAPTETAGLRIGSTISMIHGSPIAAAAILEANDDEEDRDVMYKQPSLPTTELEAVDSGNSDLYSDV